MHSPVDSILHPSSHSGTGYSGVTRLGNPEAHRVWKHRTLDGSDMQLPPRRQAYPLDLDTTLKEMQVGSESRSRSGRQDSAVRTTGTNDPPPASKKRKLDSAGDSIDTEYDHLVDSLTDRDLPKRMVQRVIDKWLRGDDVHILYRQ